MSIPENMSPSDQEQLKLDKIMFGNAYYKPGKDGQYERVCPFNIIIEYEGDGVPVYRLREEDA